jgi:hypothetical protein
MHMTETCARAVAAGIEGIAFGDLFLEDLRGYREKQMKAGPMLNVDIPISVGESVVRDNFVFADLNTAAMSATPLSQ